jgi:hypothetical protein
MAFARRYKTGPNVTFESSIAGYVSGGATAYAKRPNQNADTLKMYMEIALGQVSRASII